MPRRRPVQAIAANANRATTKSRTSVYNERGKSKVAVADCESPSKASNRERTSGGERIAGNGNAEPCGVTTSKSTTAQPRWTQMDTPFQYLHKKFKKMECVENSSGCEDPNTTSSTSATATTATATIASTTKGLEDQEEHSNSNNSQLALEALFQVTGRELEKINETDCPLKDPKEVNGNSGPFTTAPPVSKNPGRHVCPYCGHGCAKPSILQKHIRAHTNERPYTCEPCGFAFKTTSNLYKHRKSRAHALKLGLATPSGTAGAKEEDEEDVVVAEGPEAAVEEEEEDTAEEPGDDEHVAQTAPIYKPKFHSVATKRVLGPEEEATKNTVPSLAKRRNEQLQLKLKIPKPPVVVTTPSTCNTPSSSSSSTSSSSSPSRSPGSAAASPAKGSGSGSGDRTPKFASPEYVQQRISKLISENAAIVEIQDPLWQKRNLRHSSNSSSSSLSPGELRSPQCHSPLTPSSLQLSPRTPPVNTCSSATVMPKSKLALALLNRTFSPQPSPPLPLPPPPQTPTNAVATAPCLNPSSSAKAAVSTTSVIVSNGIANPVSYAKPLLAVVENTTATYQTNNQPGGSIIKDLLLKSREGMGTQSQSQPTKKVGLEQEAVVQVIVPTSPQPVAVTAASDASRHMCISCNMKFQRVENLQAHQSYYCRPQNAAQSPAAPLASYPTSAVTKADCNPPPKARGRPKGSKNRPKSQQDSALYSRTVTQSQPFYDPRGPELALCVLKSRVAQQQPGSGNNGMSDYDGPILKRHLLARADQSPPPAKKQLKSRAVVATSPQMADYSPFQPCTMAFAVTQSQSQSQLRHFVGGKLQLCPNSSTTSFTFADPAVLRSLSVSDYDDALGGSCRIPAPGVVKQSNNASPSSSCSSSLSSSSSSNTFVQTIAKPVLNSGGTVRQVSDAKESPVGCSSSCLPMVSIGSSRVGARTGALSGGGVVTGEPEMLITSTALTIPISISTVPMNTFPIDISHLHVNVATSPLRPTRLALPLRSPLDSAKATVITRLGCSSQSSCSSMSPVSTPVKSSFGSESSDNSPDDGVIRSPRSPKCAKSAEPAEQSTITTVRRAVPATRPTTLSLRPPERPLSLTEKFLVSPETPRPKKKYAQCFHNGQHYTYLALKQSTRVFYCCIHWAQPMYVPQSAAPNLSMYSVWKTVPAEPDALGLTPSEAMMLYDSRNRYSMYTVAQSKTPLQVTHSSYWSFKEHARKGGDAKDGAVSVSSVVVEDSREDDDADDSDTVINVEDYDDDDDVDVDDDDEDDDEDDGDGNGRWKERGKMTEREVNMTSMGSSNENATDRVFAENVSECDSDGTEDEDRSSKHKSVGEDDGVTEPKRVRIFEGGFKSNEDYTYVRGRGRGKYVCEECGIRCKKPSMLKKHIRTHTDVRPYTCKHCNFSFKTKGNLTKHMKSKAHHKKCVELGLDPIPVTIDDSQIDEEALVRQERIEQQRKHFAANDNDDDDDEEEDEDGEEDEEYGRNFDYGDEDDEMMDVEAEDDSRSVRSLGQFEDAEPCDEAFHEHTAAVDVLHEPPVVNSRLDHEAAHSLLDLSKPNDPVAMKISGVRSGSKANCTINDISTNSNNSSDFKETAIRRTGLLANYPPVSTAVIVSPMMEDRDVLIGNPRVVWSVESTAVQMQNQMYATSPLQLLGCRDDVQGENDVSRQNSSKDKCVLVAAPPKSSLELMCAARPSLEGDGDQPMDLSMPQTRHGAPCKGPGAGGDAYTEEDSHFTEEHRETRRIAANVTYTAYENVLPSAAEEDEDDVEDAAQLKSLGTSRGPLYLAPMFAGSRPHEYRRSLADVEGGGCWDEDRDEELRRLHSFPNMAVEESRENARSPCESRTRINSTTLETQEELRTLPSPPSAAAVAAMGVASAQKKADDTPLSSAPQPTTTVVSQFGFPLRVSKVNSSASSSSSSEINAKQMLDYSPAVSGSGLQRSIDDGKCVCSICNKSFSKPSQLRLHVNIHYFERPFRCESCAISFRTKGHLQKHKRSVSHYNKVNMNLTFGTPTTDNPRPFKCADCKIAFRIHGHLAKHLRSKMHIMKLECLGKLPFGTYAEFERSGANLNEIDTTDCDNSLDSLQTMACKVFGGNAQRWPRERTTSGCSSDDLSDGVPFAESPVEASSVHPAAVQQTSPHVAPPLSTVAAANLVSSVRPSPTRHRAMSVGEDSSLSPDLAEMWSQKSVFEGGGTSRQGLVAADNLPKAAPLAEPLESSAGFSGRIAHQKARDHLALVQEYEDVSDVDSDSGLSVMRNCYTCRLCGKILKNAKVLQIHYMEHSARMPDAEDADVDSECTSLGIGAATYPALGPLSSMVDGLDCELCGRNFSSRSDLKQHLQTHALPRPFVCEVCDAGFTTAQNLKVHRFTHTRLMQEESVACNECHIVFDDLASLDNHMLRYHPSPALGQEQARCRIRQVADSSAASDFVVARPAA